MRSHESNPDAPDGNGPPRAAPTRVLVAEDESFVAMDIAMALEDEGVDVVGPFATLADTLDAIERNPPDAAILDVNLLDGDVEPALVRLRDLGRRVAVNTGSCDLDLIRRRFADVPVFAKPTPVDTLAKAIGIDMAA